MQTHSSVRILLLILGASLLSSQPAAAACNPGRDQVAFYEHAKYQGKCVVLGVGRYENAEEMGIAGDTISSAKLGLGVRAVSYEHSDFRGRAYRHDQSERAFPLVTTSAQFPGSSSRYKPGDKASSVIVIKLQNLAPAFELKGDTRCAWGSKECNRCVNNVKANFNAIETHFRGERAGKIHVSSYAYPAKNALLHRIHAWNEHIQGIGRIAGLGNEEYLVFTHSTKSDQSGKSGALAVIRMGANQNSKGFELGDLSEKTGSDQNIHNRTVARTFSDSNHPGGLATLGHYVFVADWCQPHGEYGWCNSPSQFSFEVYDVSNVHRNVGQLNSNPPIRIIDRSVKTEGHSKRSKSTASVAATRLQSGNYLVAIGRSGGSNYEYYLSSTTSLSSGTKWLSAGYPEDIAKHGEGAAMVNECVSGDIYLIQIENSGTRGNLRDNKDELHLFRLNRSSDSGPIKHQYVNSRTFRCSDGTPWCNLDKGGGIYTSPAGNLYLYATDAQQAKDTERFRMVEFGNYRETGPSSGQGTNRSCSNSSLATCNKHGAKCTVVHTLSGVATDLCHWPSKNTPTACKRAQGFWTTPASKYSKNHPDAVPPGSSGICASEVKNLRNLKPTLIEAVVHR